MYLWNFNWRIFLKFVTYNSFLLFLLALWNFTKCLCTYQLGLWWVASKNAVRWQMVAKPFYSICTSLEEFCRQHFRAVNVRSSYLGILLDLSDTHWSDPDYYMDPGGCLNFPLAMLLLLLAFLMVSTFMTPSPPGRWSTGGHGRPWGGPCPMVVATPTPSTWVRPLRGPTLAAAWVSGIVIATPV